MGTPEDVVAEEFFTPPKSIKDSEDKLAISIIAGEDWYSTHLRPWYAESSWTAYLKADKRAKGQSNG